LVPTSEGLQPTNVRAAAVYVDALGNEGALAFPVPWTHVLRPEPLAPPTATATATSEAPTATPTATPTASPSATPADRRQIYLPMAARSPACIVTRVEADVVLVLDMSTSMDRPTGAGRTKREAALAAARLFVDQLQAVTAGRDQIAVVGFNEIAWTATDLTTDLAEARRAVDTLAVDVREGTRLDLALDEAYAAVTGPARRPINVAAVVLLTDGLPNRVPTPVSGGSQEDTVLAAAARLKATGALLYTIGLGAPEDVRSWMLQLAATSPDMYYETPDAERLAAIYRGILVRLVCGPR
jgi:Mg-chelatase subunit ChlD